MEITKLIKQCENYYKSTNSRKTLKIIELCQSFLPFEKNIKIKDRKIDFPVRDKDLKINEAINDLFFSKLATIEFGYNGWVFTGGSHKPLARNTEIQAEEFGRLFGEKFGKKTPLATGANGGFMEAVNKGYIKSNNDSITSTTRFLGLSQEINDKIKYCFIASTFSSMESFLINNSIAGVFFDGGIGTAYEIFSMLCERQRESIEKNIPMIFVNAGNQNNFYNDIKMMEQECEINQGFPIMYQSCKIYPEDSKNIYSVETAADAIKILGRYIKADLNTEDVEHDFVREIFKVAKNRAIYQ